MMRWIVTSSLKFRFLVVPVAAAMLVLGFTQVRAMPVDTFPEFTPPLVQIRTEALGLSAAEVEQLITVPLEADLLNGVAWLDEIRSESVPGLSSVDLIFEPGTDILRARQLVQERLTGAAGLPNVSKAPQMLQSLSSTSRVMVVGLSSKELSLTELSVLARWKIKPRLLGVPGVANVAIWGQRERQLQVQVDPDRLRDHGVSLVQVMKTTGNALWVSPLTFVEASTPGTGGFIDTPNQRLSIQHILPITSAEDLAKVSMEPDESGAPQDTNLRLGDVATVVEDHQPLIGDAVVNDDPSLMLVIEKFPEENAVGVTRRVEAALDAQRPGLSGITIDTSVYRPATFIERTLDNLVTVSLVALLLVLLLILLLASWRAALVSLVAIPLSLAAALLVLYWRGATFNAMVLAGLVMAVGVVVGDAVTDIDAIRLRLQQHREAGGERSTAAVVLGATLEARTPIIYATLVIVVATVPVFFLQGVTGAFSRPLALTYLLAVLASMVVALTVTPALAFMLSSETALGRRKAPLIRRPQEGYRAALSWLAQRSRWAYAAAGVVVLAGLAVVPFLTQSTLPSAKETDVLIRWDGSPGTSHPEMARITAAASRELRSIPGVRNVGAHVGRAITSDEVVGINSGELWVSIDPAADYDATITAIRGVADGYPGLSHDVQTYPDQRINEVRTGTKGDVVVRLYGQDPQVLRSKAAEVAAAVSGIDGVAGTRVDEQAEEPTLEVQVDLALAERHGIKPGDVRRAAATLLSGVEVGSLFEEQKVFEVVVWSSPETRNSLTSVRELMIDKPGGGQVRLGDVAQVRITPSPNVIKRDSVSRYVDVGIDVSGRAAGSVANDVESRIRTIEFPFEHHAEVLGDAAERQAAQLRLIGLAVVAAILAFLLFQAAFASWRLATLAFLSLPVALSGGVIALLVSGRTVSLATVAGLLAVLGIAARQCLLLIRHYQRLEEDCEALGIGLVLRGATERLAPMVITSLATALALIPVVLVADIPGRDAVQPLAVVILGGLVTSTLLYLFVLPSLYLGFAPRSESGPSSPEAAQITPPEDRGAAQLVH